MRIIKKLFTLLIAVIAWLNMSAQNSKDSIYLIKGYAEVELDNKSNKIFLEKELIKLATIDAIEKQFGKVVYSENSIDIKNSNVNKTAITNTEFNSLNKTFVKADVKQIIDQKIDEKEVSGYAEVNGIKKLFITKYLTCNITCKAKESPVNIEFAVQVDKILSQVDSLQKQIKQIDLDVSLLKKSNIILDATSIEEKLYNIGQLLVINKNKEAEPLIDSYLNYINAKDSFDIENYLLVKPFWYKQLGRTYSYPEDIITIIKKRGFNDLFGYEYIDYISYEIFQNKNKYLINSNNFEFENYQLYINFLEPLAKLIPENSFLFKKYISLYLIDLLKFESDCEVNIGGIGRAQWVDYKGDLIANTSHIKDSIKCVMEAKKWKLDKFKYPHLYETLMSVLYKIDELNTDELKNYIELNSPVFSKYGDNKFVVRDNYVNQFKAPIGLTYSYYTRKNNYVERIERNKSRSHYENFLEYESVLFKLFTN